MTHVPWIGRTMKTPDELRGAEEFFHTKIPLTRAMGVRVVCDDERRFVVTAPVALNYNHLHTAFGGSINAVAMLAGYGLLWMQLRGEAAHVVIAESSIRFLQPVRETIRAICARPDAHELETFHSTLRAKSKAKIALHVRVEEDGKVAAELVATFVALRDAG
ncbi:MAG TPA: YiiD C-terminal domain-containing protein [Chthoniobacterales bacterium]|nr:YiiD C-terminal domain-containing protein [Chthoniobacterales bacterium]